MAKLPKLKIVREDGYPFEEIRDIKQAQHLPFKRRESTQIVMAEGKLINSYEELVTLATQGGANNTTGNRWRVKAILKYRGASKGCTERGSQYHD